MEPASIWSKRVKGALSHLLSFDRHPEALEAEFEEIDLKNGESAPLFDSPCSGEKLLIIITTCNRERQLLTLLSRLRGSLVRAGAAQGARLLVVEDRAESTYDAARLEVRHMWEDRVTWVRSRSRMGKQKYFRTYQVAFDYMKRSDAPRALFLQDDLEIDESFWSRTDALFRSLLAERREQPLLLNLYSSTDDEPKGRWIDFERRAHDSLPVRRTQWFDLNGYLVERKAFELLDFEVHPIGLRRWKKDPTLSSGVGRQLTRRLHRRADIFQCYPPLVFHGKEPSVMNPEARFQRSLDNHHLKRLGSDSKSPVFLAGAEVVSDG